MGLLSLHMEFIHLNLSFGHLCLLRFYFCQASLWKSASTPWRGKQGKETLFTVTSLSLLMWLPYLITSFLFLATDIFSSLSEIVFLRLYNGSIVLFFANSFLNPILYTMRMPGFRRALKILCRQRPQPHRQVEIIPLREINPQI